MAGLYQKLRGILTGSNGLPQGAVKADQFVAKIIIPASSASYAASQGASVAGHTEIVPCVTDIVRRSVATGEIIDSVLARPEDLAKEATESFEPAQPVAESTATVTALPLRQSFARQIPLPV